MFSIILLYPVLIYSDLAGMGGYDGFASTEMMAKHGAWASTESGHTLVYSIFAGLSLIWVLSVLNVPIALVMLIRGFVYSKNVEG